jgi:hypothetical protein
MPVSLRRSALVGVLAAVALLVSAPGASAAPFNFTNWDLTGSITLAKLKQSIAFPAGSKFNGSLELTNGQLTGHVTVPQFTSRLKVFGLPVDATIEFVEAQPVTGQVTFGSPNITIDATTSATLKIRRLSSPLVPLNLVGTSCRTSEPVVLPLHYVGPPTLFTGFTFQGTTTIPRLTRCGLATPLLNQLMAGSGNAFTATIAPPA